MKFSRFAYGRMKDFLLEIGDVTLYGSKDATREAFKTELINDGDVWMEMIKSRNKTFQTYNEENEYHTAFIQFQEEMEGKK